jgi:hypothetical protein
MTLRATHLPALVTTLLALALALMSLLAPAPAHASPKQVVRDCAEDGVVDGDYSNADKRRALRQIPADLDEYSDCRAVIRGSIGSPGGGGRGRIPVDSDGDGVFDSSRPGRSGPIGAAAGASGSDGGGAGGPSKPSRKRGETAGKVAPEQPRSITADPVIAGLFDTASTSNGLPLPVLLALIALALLAVAGSVNALRQRRPAFVDGALRRVPRLRRRG